MCGDGECQVILLCRAELVDLSISGWLARGACWLEPGRAVLAAKDEDGRGDLPQLGRGYPARGDGQVVGERGGQGFQGCYPRGTVHLREHLANASSTGCWPSALSLLIASVSTRI